MKKPNIAEGEWSLTDKYHHPSGWERCIDNGLDKICVVECYEGDESNARAIRAVPDMIDALLKAHEIVWDLKHGAARHLIDGVELKQIEQALIKAGVNINETGTKDA